MILAWILVACVLAAIYGAYRQLGKTRQYTGCRQRTATRVRRYLTVYTDRRNIWVGYQRGDSHHYVCPVPCVVVRWAREPNAADPADAIRPVVPRDPGGHARRVPKAGQS